MHELNAGGNSLIIFCFHKNLWFVNQTPCHSVTEPCGSYEAVMNIFKLSLVNTPVNFLTLARFE